MEIIVLETAMYNMQHGVAPFSGNLLNMLGLESRHVPRLRDVYVDVEDHIVVFTRTGGGNRANFEALGQPSNTGLERLPGFLRTEDWELDTTYAKFVYDPPPSCRELVRQYARLGACRDPTKLHNDLVADMESETPKKTTLDFLDKMKPVVERIHAQFEAGETVMGMFDGD